MEDAQAYDPLKDLMRYIVQTTNIGDYHMIKEITARELNSRTFINEKVKEIKETVGDGMAINALSGGVDSSTVTMLGHRALGKQLRTVFIQNGLMREGEPARGVALFKK